MFISKERKKQLRAFQKTYGIKFKNLSLLNQAFVHTSYTNENNLDVSYSYEKLEFYGDAVLKLIISDFLYNHFENYNEGELTKLRAEIVSDKNIFEYAKKLGFEELILLGKNEKKQGGAKKESILACAFEAFLGAIFIEYKNKGYKKAHEFLKDNFRSWKKYLLFKSKSNFAGIYSKHKSSIARVCFGWRKRKSPQERIFCRS